MRLVKSKAKPMAVGGTLISGTLMAALAAAYVKAVNEGEPPVVPCDALVNTARRCCQHVQHGMLVACQSVTHSMVKWCPQHAQRRSLPAMLGNWYRCCPARSSHPCSCRPSSIVLRVQVRLSSRPVLPGVCVAPRCCAPASDCLAGCVQG
jgi:hypothetical protein